MIAGIDQQLIQADMLFRNPAVVFFGHERAQVPFDIEPVMIGATAEFVQMAVRPAGGGLDHLVQFVEKIGRQFQPTPERRLGILQIPHPIGHRISSERTTLRGNRLVELSVADVRLRAALTPAPNIRVDAWKFGVVGHLGDNAHGCH